MEQERQTEPLDQKKPWSELTEEEREAIRESWKHTLPEEFDVCYDGELLSLYDLKIPGNLYVKCDVIIPFGKLTVNGNFISDGDISAAIINVHGDCIIRHYVDSLSIDVGGLFDCYDVDVNGHEIHAADYVCRYYEEEV